MYLPSKFQCQDKREIRSLMESYPLATVITIVDNNPLISHLPMVVETGPNGDLVLIGHMSKANPHSRHIKKSETTLIFHGPNAYITPKWYEQNDVPTWNYAVVHCKGLTKLILDANGIQNCLKKLTHAAEKNSLDPWDFWLPDDLSDPTDLTTAIVGFEVTISEINAKFKLSQNRSSVDRKGVIGGLGSRTDDNSKAIQNLIIANEAKKNG
ncbi:MAG: FMN-binding negative transcriptional regulator [Pseudomonadota bacterium]